MQLPTLPEDVIHNILSRLPVKSLMKFRCVSKSVNSLVHDPRFVKSHLRRALEDFDMRRALVTTNPPLCIFTENVSKVGNQVQDMTTPVEYPPGVIVDEVEIIGSCNGLICFMDCGEYDIFIVWNPSTRAFREVAKPGQIIGRCPDVIPIYGFGYDQASDDYKIIVAVSPSDGTNSTELEIYSLKQNAWRKMQASLPCILTTNFWRLYEPCFPGLNCRGAGVFTDGAVHWLEKRTINNHESDLILSFNLAKEQFEEVIPLLNYDKENSLLSELQVLGGHLSVLVHKTAEIETWVMEDYGIKSSWTKIATMPEDPGPAFADTFISDWLVPFSLCRNGRMLVDMDGNELSVYDPQDMSFVKLDLGGNENMFLVREFVESLVSPQGV